MNRWIWVFTYTWNANIIYVPKSPGGHLVAALASVLDVRTCYLAGFLAPWIVNAKTKSATKRMRFSAVFQQRNYDKFYRARIFTTLMYFIDFLTIRHWYFIVWHIGSLTGLHSWPAGLQCFPGQSARRGSSGDGPWLVSPCGMNISRYPLVNIQKAMENHHF